MALANYSGGETVLNYNPLRQDYQNNQRALASAQKQEAMSRENALKQTASLVNKINPNGLRTADIPEFTKLYEEFRNLGTQVANAGSIAERAQASSEMQGKFADMQLYINASKNIAGLEKQYGDKLIANPYRTSDVQLNRLSEVNKLPSTQLGNLDWANEFKLGARPEVWNNFINTATNEIQQEVKAVDPVLKSLGGFSTNGRSFIRERQIRELPEQTFIAKLQQGYSSNGEIKDYVDELARQQNKSVDQIIQDVVNQNRPALRWSSDIQTRDVTAPRSSKSSSGEDVGSFGTPIPKRFESRNGGRVRTFDSEQYLPYNGGTISLPQSKNFTNITDGNQVPSNSLKNAEVTGRGYFPKAGGGVIKGFTVSAQDAENDRVVELFIPDREVPYDFKNNKKTLAAEKALGEYKKPSQPTQRKTTTKKTETFAERMARLRK